MTARTLRAVGVDVGTSALKAVRVATVGGRVTIEAVASEPYTPSRRPSRSPRAWLVAAGRALAMVVDGPIETIGFTGQMHALVPVRGGRSLGQTMLWLDMAGALYLEAFVRAHPDLSLLHRTGNIPLPDFTLAKWLALRNQSPGLANQVETLPAAKDFVRNAFAADGPAVTDVNEAAGAQWYDPFKHSWDGAICAAAGIPSSALSQVVDPTTVVGYNTSRRLPIGVPIVAGAGRSTDRCTRPRQRSHRPCVAQSWHVRRTGGPVATGSPPGRLGRRLPPVPNRHVRRIPDHRHDPCPGRRVPLGHPSPRCRSGWVAPAGRDGEVWCSSLGALLSLPSRQWCAAPRRFAASATTRPVGSQHAG